MKTQLLINNVCDVVYDCITDKLTGSLTIRIDFSQGGIGHAQARREYKSAEPDLFTVKKTTLNGSKKH